MDRGAWWATVHRAAKSRTRLKQLSKNNDSCIYRRRQWHPTPVLLPGKYHGWRSLVGYSPWDCKESDTTEQLQWCSQGSSEKQMGTSPLFAIHREEGGVVFPWEPEEMRCSGWTVREEKGGKFLFPPLLVLWRRIINDWMMGRKSTLLTTYSNANVILKIPSQTQPEIICNLGMLWTVQLTQLTFIVNMD